MKKIITLFKNVSFVALFATLLLACSKEDTTTEPPTIERVEIGHHNSRKGYIGDDLHLEATIKAEETIKEIKVVIKAQQGSTTIEKTFPKYAEKKVVHFHEHIDIPADAQEGKYDLTLTITDLKEKTATLKTVLTVEKDPATEANEHKPSIGAIELGHDNSKVGTIGDDLHVEALLKAKHLIAEVKLVIASPTDASLKIEQTFPQAVDKEVYKLHQHVDIPANFTEGKYNLTLTLTDKEGEKAELKEEITLKKGA